MKVLSINGDFYLYPANVKSIDEFALFLESYNNKFLKMRKLFENNCVNPYYIFEEIREVQLSIGSIDEFFEEEVVILNRDEYEKMLGNVMNKLCKRCEEKENCLKSEKQEYREKLCLDCTCYEFCEEE